MRKEIFSTVSQVRTMDNLNQYLFLDYMYHKGKAIRERLSGKFFSIATSSASSIGEYLRNPSRKLVCINDVHLKDEAYVSERRILLDSFDAALPKKSVYEK